MVELKNNPLQPGYSAGRRQAGVLADLLDERETGGARDRLLAISSFDAQMLTVLAHQRPAPRRRRRPCWGVPPPPRRSWSARPQRRGTPAAPAPAPACCGTTAQSPPDVRSSLPRGRDLRPPTLLPEARSRTCVRRFGVAPRRPRGPVDAGSAPQRTGAGPAGTRRRRAPPRSAGRTPRRRRRLWRGSSGGCQERSQARRRHRAHGPPAGRRHRGGRRRARRLPSGRGTGLRRHGSDRGVEGACPDDADRV